MTRQARLKPNWPNIAALAVTSASTVLVAWGMLGLAAGPVCAL